MRKRTSWIIRLLSFVLLLFQVMFVLRGSASASSSSWTNLGGQIPGVNGTVYALALASDGSLYVGGNFAFAGDITAANIAKWDGSHWLPVGSGVNGTVSALAFDANGNLFAGGAFTTAGGAPISHIAKWDGNSWSAIGGGMDNSVSAIVFDSSGNLFAGGSFTSAGGSPASYVAKWDGTSWSGLSGGVNAPLSINSLAVNKSNGQLYVVGGFTSAGGIAANRIAVWDGTAWSTFGTGANAQVNGVAVGPAGEVVIAGDFTSVSDTTAGKVAKWDGSTWAALTLNSPDQVTLPAFDIDGSPIVTGSGTVGVKKWNGTNWSTLFALSNVANSLLVGSDSRYYVGGNLTAAGGTLVSNIAIRSGSKTIALGSGFNSTVNALTQDPSGKLYATGSFSETQDGSMNHLAVWDGVHWAAADQKAIVTSGVPSIFFDDDGSMLYSNSSNAVEKWDGGTVTSFGTAANNTVYCLIPDGRGNIYACGAFTTIGGVAAISVAKWDGHRWSALGPGLGGYVTDLAFDPNGLLYAAGNFESPNGLPVSFLAKWDGASWTQVGGVNPNNGVKAIAFDPLGNMYIGGWFTKIGSKQVNYVAKWDGITWSALGGGMDGVVYSLAIAPNGYLFAGGGFARSDGQYTNNISYWNGTAWNSIGTGAGATVNSVLVQNVSPTSVNVFIGGVFTQTSSTRIMNRVGSVQLDIPAPPDSFPPAAKVLLSQKGYTNSPLSVSITATDQNGVGHIYCKMITDSSFADAGAGPCTLTVSANGSIQYYAVDSLGNSFGSSSAPMIYGVTNIDATPPTAPVATATPATWTNGQSVILAANGSTDNEAGVSRYQYSPDNVTWTDGNSVTVRNEGNACYVFRALDYPGNVSPNSNQVCAQIDRTGPSAPTVAIAPAGWTNAATVVLTAGGSVDAGAGFGKYQSSTTGTSGWTDGPSVSQTVEGNSCLYFRAVDTLGNASANSSQACAQIDRTAPPVVSAAIESTGIQSGASESTVRTPTFSWTAPVDTLSGIKSYNVYFGLDAAGTATAEVALPGYVALTPITDTGNYYLRVRSVDNAGNASAWQTAYTLNYLAPPSLPVTTVTETHGVQSDVLQRSINQPGFTWAAPDAKVDAYGVYFGSNSAGTSDTFAPDTSYVADQIATTGSYYLRIRTRNTASQMSAWQTVFIFKFEATPPAAAPSVSPQKIDFGAHALTGATQTFVGTTTPWTVSDLTGTGSGWHMTVKVSDFILTENSSKRIPATAFKTQLANTAVVIVDGNTKPVSNVPGWTVLSSSDQTIMTATPGAGMGTYTILPVWSIDIPGDAYAGHYTAILTATITATP